MPPELVAAVGAGAVCGAIGGAVLGAIFGVVVAHHYGRLPGWAWVLITLFALALIVLGSVLGFQLSEHPVQPGATPSSLSTRSTRVVSPPAKQSTGARSAGPSTPQQSSAVGEATGLLLDRYDDTGTVGEAVCTGNSNDPAAQPSGQVAQTFTVPADYTTITDLLVQVDPQPTLTVHLTLTSDTGVTATASATAVGDTRFTGLEMPVRAGQIVTASFTMSATAKSGVTMYVVPGGYGTVTFTNTCAWGGGANLNRTTQGLRMQVTGLHAASN